MIARMCILSYDELYSSCHSIAVFLLTFCSVDFDLWYSGRMRWISDTFAKMTTQINKHIIIVIVLQNRKSASAARQQNDQAAAVIDASAAAEKQQKDRDQHLKKLAEEEETRSKCPIGGCQYFGSKNSVSTHLMGNHCAMTSLLINPNLMICQAAQCTLVSIDKFFITCAM